MNMNQTHKKLLILLGTVAVVFVARPLYAQTELPERWTVRACIDYAHEHNIQVKQAEVSRQSGEADLLQAKADRVPSLSFSSSQGLSHQDKDMTDGTATSAFQYTGSYNLNSGLTLYGGGQVRNSIKLQEVNNLGLDWSIQGAKDNIEIAVAQAFVDILYAYESLVVLDSVVALSQQQLERTQAMRQAGMVAVSDVAQMESQLASDQYSQVQARQSLAINKLTLKQLLELDYDVPFEIEMPTIDEADILVAVPSFETIYPVAYRITAEVQNSEIDLEAAQVQEKISNAQRLPSLSLSMGVGTGSYSSTGTTFWRQFSSNLNESVGLSLSVPIFNNRQGRTAVEKAKLQTQNAALSLMSAQKDLVKELETLYQNVYTYQELYTSATAKLKATEESYRLVNEQFSAGLKNPVELLTEKNNYLDARTSQTQAKFQALLALKILHFYNDESINF